jgi:hypothetical protein
VSGDNTATTSCQYRWSSLVRPPPVLLMLVPLQSTKEPHEIVLVGPLLYSFRVCSDIKSIGTIEKYFMRISKW